MKTFRVMMILRVTQEVTVKRKELVENWPRHFSLTQNRLQIKSGERKRIRIAKKLPQNWTQPQIFQNFAFQINRLKWQIALLFSLMMMYHDTL